MATSIKTMNKALYMAAAHLVEAGKYLSNIEEFRPEASKLLMMADELATIIVPEEQKVSDDKMLDILDEILGNKNG